MPPCADGVLIKMRQVFIAASNLASFSLPVSVLTYSTEVCPMPPSAMSLEALAIASSKSSALYIASTGDSFS